MSELRALSDLSTVSSADSFDYDLIDLGTLYSIRRPEVVRYLVTFGMNAIEAEDITQEAFLEACNPAAKKSPEHLFYWILVCARNIALKRIRRGKHEILLPAESWKNWEKTLPDESPSTEALLLERERFERFLRALSELDPVEQQVIVFRGQGRTYREVAEALKMSLRSAAYLTNVAIQKMRRKLRVR